MLENARETRKRLKQLWWRFRTFNEQVMWEKINQRILDGDVLSGHIHYGYPRLQDSALRYITLIRKPIGQFVSEYKWMRHGYNKRPFIQKIYHHGRTRAAAKSLDYYLDFLIEHRKQYSNTATRFICGEENHLDPFRHLKDNYWHFGILERPDIFARDFERKTGKQFQLGHMNPSPSNSQVELTHRQYDKFEILHERDITLYSQVESYLLEQHQR